ncbi:ABC transporter permease [Micromonospora fulviviridis]|uniref:ABC transporter permease n=1 Tax=Micromonospora fulviviridis TaxID=47860 RepID=UPI0037AF42C3
MTSTMLALGPKLAVALALLTAAAAAVATIGRLGHGRQIAVAAAHAALQLAAVSLVITAIIASLRATTAFVLLMCAVAAGTSGPRITGGPHGWWAGVPNTTASLTVVAALLLAGLVPLRGIAIIPIAGILTGGAMTATSLAGRRFNDDLRAQRGEVEAALALELLPEYTRDVDASWSPTSASAASPTSTPGSCAPSLTRSLRPPARRAASPPPRLHQTRRPFTNRQRHEGGEGPSTSPHGT